jgi:hypothetical protein
LQTTFVPQYIYDAKTNITWENKCGLKETPELETACQLSDEILDAVKNTMDCIIIVLAKEQIAYNGNDIVTGFKTCMQGIIQTRITSPLIIQVLSGGITQLLVAGVSISTAAGDDFPVDFDITAYYDSLLTYLDTTSDVVTTKLWVEHATEVRYLSLFK